MLSHTSKALKGVANEHNQVFVDGYFHRRDRHRCGTAGTTWPSTFRENCSSDGWCGSQDSRRQGLDFRSFDRPDTAARQLRLFVMEGLDLRFDQLSADCLRDNLALTHRWKVVPLMPERSF